jgi:hypothetical protein
MEGKKIRWQDGVQALWTLCKYRVMPRNSFLALSVRMQVSATPASPQINGGILK